MLENNRTTEKTFLNTIKEPIAYNLQNICKIALINPLMTPSKKTKKLEKVQYSAALIITGAIKGTSWERLYKDLGLEFFCDRRLCHKLVFFYKIVKGLAP